MGYTENALFECDRCHNQSQVRLQDAVLIQRVVPSGERRRAPIPQGWRQLETISPSLMVAASEHLLCENCSGMFDEFLDQRR